MIRASMANRGASRGQPAAAADAWGAVANKARSHSHGPVDRDTAVAAAAEATVTTVNVSDAHAARKTASAEAAVATGDAATAPAPSKPPSPSARAVNVAASSAAAVANASHAHPSLYPPHPLRRRPSAADGGRGTSSGPRRPSHQQEAGPLYAGGAAASAATAPDRDTPQGRHRTAGRAHSAAAADAAAAASLSTGGKLLQHVPPRPTGSGGGWRHEVHGGAWRHEVQCHGRLAAVVGGGGAAPSQSLVAAGAVAATRGLSRAGRGRQGPRDATATGQVQPPGGHGGHVGATAHRGGQRRRRPGTPSLRRPTLYSTRRGGRWGAVVDGRGCQGGRPPPPGTGWLMGVACGHGWGWVAPASVAA